MKDLDMRDDLIKRRDKGIEVLDLAVGRESWLSYIPQYLEELNMGDYGKCVLAFYGGGCYTDGLRAVYSTLQESDDPEVQNMGWRVEWYPWDYGFDRVMDNEDSDIYPALTEVWRERIKDLREGGE